MKKKYNPSTTSKTEFVGFRCPIDTFEKMNNSVKISKLNKTGWLVEAVLEKIKKDQKTLEMNSDDT